MVKTIKSVQLITLGCSKNRVDSEHLLKQIVGAGVIVVPEEEATADVRPDAILLNTCGFIKDAKEESVEAILEAVEHKRRGETSFVFVFGCLSQRYRRELEEEIPEVDGYHGTFDYPEVLKALGMSWDNSLNNTRLLTTPSHYAYLKISEGCDRICSYCSIPMIRGNHLSVSMEDLVSEATYLASCGVKELIVIAQDTTFYGLDIYGKRRLGDLLDRLSLIDGIQWIRLLYSYPASFPLDVIDVIRDNPKVCNYLDIPLQHINDVVLKNMRRGVDSSQTRRLVDMFRDKIPGIVLRTTMIVGHPGESDNAFKQLMDFVNDVKFERLGAFTYSEEEGTWGALNLPDEIPESVKHERLDRLMELQAGISLDFNQKREGSVQRVLVDSFRDGLFFARSMAESPEVDGEVIVSSAGLPDGLLPKDIIGTFAEVQIDSVDEYDLYARFI
jgi:ribosomal protein S12 methylthiotransferase